MPRIGLSENAWRTAKEEVRTILRDAARIRKMIPYSELTAKVQSVRNEPHSQVLFNLLGEISEEEGRAGRGLLSVLVVHKDGDMRPGPGFFNVAKAFGADVSDIDRCWVSELDKVLRYWAVERAVEGTS